MHHQPITRCPCASPMKHPAYIPPRLDQHGHVVECRGGGRVRAFECAEVLTADAVQRATSEFRRLFGVQPQQVEVI